MARLETYFAYFSVAYLIEWKSVVLDASRLAGWSIKLPNGGRAGRRSLEFHALSLSRSSARLIKARPVQALGEKWIAAS